MRELDITLTCSTSSFLFKQWRELCQEANAWGWGFRSEDHRDGDQAATCVVRPQAGPGFFQHLGEE